MKASKKDLVLEMIKTELILLVYTRRGKKAECQKEFKIRAVEIKYFRPVNTHTQR